jgi:hypothetical protein
MIDDTILRRIDQKASHGCVSSQIIEPIWNPLLYDRFALSCGGLSGGSFVDQLIVL